jgi:hypothetical protein
MFSECGPGDVDAVDLVIGPARLSAHEVHVDPVPGDRRGSSSPLLPELLDDQHAAAAGQESTRAASLVAPMGAIALEWEQTGGTVVG